MAVPRRLFIVCCFYREMIIMLIRLKPVIGTAEGCCGK